ncbi:glutathione ABC transporter substrate-binding protein [Ornithinibacillus californiensis]|uniref:glutathione ABC transporter substrate-binding protein n=1 Tax=Ornithinibacillus californiensis TaxID=161536 RepID=UPI00064DC8D5|nr:glutathione ABC transporter substrate-binding protein [Ornithinibacillus californiensis]
MKKLLFFSLILMAILLVVGCSSQDNSGDNASESSGKKDTLIFAPNTDAVILDPQHMNDNTSEQVIRMIYNGLLRFNEDSEIVGDLAEDYQVSDDGLEWTFNLKEGVKFHDGSDFNAEVVKKSFDRVINKENGLNRYQLYEMIKEVEVVDEFTVKFINFEPFGAFPAIMAHTSGGILSPKAIDEYGKNLGELAESTVGTGPYKIVEWKKDQEIVLERFDDYFGEKGVTKTIIYRPIPEDASRVMALETGEVDVIQQIPANELKRLEDVDGIEIIKKSSNGQRQFRFDLTTEPYDDPLVRQAVSYAIDRQAILDHVVPGLGELSTSALAKVTWGYTDLGVIPYDPEKSKELLKQAGYPDGFKTMITTTDRYIQGVQLAEVIAEQLKEVGIEAEIIVKEWSTIVQEWGGLTADEFEQGIFIMGAGPSTLDADWGLRPIYYTAETNEQNYGFYSNKEFDSLIEQAMKETDLDKRKELYKRAQEIVYLEDPVAFWLYDQYSIIAQRDKVKGVNVSPLSLITFEKAFVEE